MFLNPQSPTPFFPPEPASFELPEQVAGRLSVQAGMVRYCLHAENSPVIKVSENDKKNWNAYVISERER